MTARVAVVGGTGDLGFGLVLRLAGAGVHVTIGSRARERAEAAAGRAQEVLGADARVDGDENAAAVKDADIAFVTVPYAGQAEIYRSIKDHVGGDLVVCDTTTPLATAVGGRPWQVLRPWHGSAAEQARALLPRGMRLVAGFHSVGAEQLEAVERPADGDVLLCGDDDEAKRAVGELVERIRDLRWVDCGRLEMARVLEPLTAVLISVNRRYGIHDAGIRMTGRDTWGSQPAGRNGRT